jgi:hypothetical protein
LGTTNKVFFLENMAHSVVSDLSRVNYDFADFCYLFVTPISARIKKDCTISDGDGAEKLSNAKLLAGTLAAAALRHRLGFT